MNVRRFVVLGCILSTAIAVLCGVSQKCARALEGDQSQISRDTDAIIDRRINKIRPEQRAEAAARLKAAHETVNPDEAVNREAARKAADRAAKARIEALHNAKARRAANEAAVNEAQARETAADIAANSAAVVTNEVLPYSTPADTNVDETSPDETYLDENTEETIYDDAPPDNTTENTENTEGGQYE